MSHAAWRGPSEEPCDFCDIQVDFKRQFQKVAQAKQQPEASAHQHAPDKETVGNHSWTLLHTMAAYYPEKPSEQVQQGMQSFIGSFAHAYPCRHCAEHLQAEMQEDPPRVESREALSQWWCRSHNKVNELLDKPQFDCSTVLQRWRRANASTLAKEDEAS